MNGKIKAVHTISLVPIVHIIDHVCVIFFTDYLNAELPAVYFHDLVKDFLAHPRFFLKSDGPAVY